jgi:ATP-dependent Lhr-like helicase
LLEPRRTPTEAAHAQAIQLLERYGVLTREAALAEGLEGGFAGVYPVLKALEERGMVRRGYFVAGLGAAQFALPGAVDRLRSFREPLPPALDDGPEPPPWGQMASAGRGGFDGGGGPRGPDPGAVVLAATDPAQPYGASLPWPAAAGGRVARRTGARVVLVDGAARVFLEASGQRLVGFPGATDDDRWVAPLRALVDTGRLRSLEVRTVDGAPVLESPAVVEQLRLAGFADGYRGLVYRPAKGSRPG